MTETRSPIAEPATLAAPAEVVLDSPRDWVAADIQAYVEANGAADRFNGMPILLLTTRGRRSSALRRTPMVYGQDGDTYIVVAADAGAPRDPCWYHNLVADPSVSLQVGAEIFSGRARTASAEEKSALWPRMTEIFPPFAAYQDATERELPIVIFERETPR